jgi:hypothetical protein
MPTIPQRIASAFAVLCGHYGDVTKMAQGSISKRPVEGLVGGQFAPRGVQSWA